MPNFSGVWNLKEQIQALAAGRWTGLPTGELYAWGSGVNGRLGDGTVVSKSSPVQVAGVDWAQVAGGRTHTAVVTLGGELYAWGSGVNGRLGDGTVIARSSPVQIGALTNWAQVAADNHTASVKTDGSLWVWGSNSAGQLGDGTTDNKSSPVQVGALTNWLQVAAGAGNTACVKTDGTLWVWGRNLFGQIGDNQTANSRFSPVQIGALTNWLQVALGYENTAAVTTGGEIYTWGRNNVGQLGQNVASTINRSSPVQIGVLTNWAQVAAGGYGTVSVKTDGTLWSWGRNIAGELGDGSTINRSSPVQIGALTNWAQASAGSFAHTACVKTDGTLFTWGSNNVGRLGDGTVINRSSPVQVGALTNWAQVSVGNAHTLAIFQGTTN